MALRLTLGCVLQKELGLAFRVLVRQLPMLKVNRLFAHEMSEGLAMRARSCICAWQKTSSNWRLAASGVGSTWASPKPSTVGGASCTTLRAVRSK